MPLYRTKGIVLRSINLSETDKLVTFMTEHFGRVKCVAKAARKIKSKFIGSLEPMSYVHLIYFGKESQTLHRLNNADIIQSFQAVREDFQKLYTGIYMNELVDAMAPEGHQEIKVFQLLLDSLEALQDQNNRELLCRMFEIRLLSLSGYRPELNHCTVCKSTRVNGWVGFSYNRRGIVCGTCMKSNGSEIKFTTGTWNYLKKMLTLEIKVSGRLKFPKGMDEEVEKVTHRLILSHVGRELKSYPFIKKMAELA
ncbi:MAG: DNA repair protein RecO [Nitrospinaceae bacterium]|nr:MAG: DNA repair protein RecO [Nitrospinaceae bacterium]